MGRNLIAILMCLVVFCVASAQNPAPDASYKVAAEDLISITVRDVPEASGEFLVRSDGKITVPLAGEVAVSGLTTEEVRVKLVDLFKRELKDPDVTVNVKQAHEDRIYALGAVKAPGVFPWKHGWRLTELTAAAGGLSAPPERVRAILFRTGDTHAHTVPMKDVFIDAKDSANLEVKPGDVVNFQSDVTVRVSVVGEVHSPGQHEILLGQGAVEAISAAGGQSAETARLTGAKLVRRGQEIPIDLYGAIVKGESQKNVVLEEGDTIIVPKITTRISVVGQVGKPGPVPAEDGRTLTLTQAVSEAGGVSHEAKTSGVQIARPGPDHKIVTTSYDIKAILKGQKDHPDPLLQDGDIVFVPQSGKAGNMQGIGVLSSLIWVGRSFGL